MELHDAQPPETVMVSNAFAVMTAAQKRLQVGDSGLPFPEPVKDR